MGKLELRADTLGGVIPSYFDVRIPGLRATREARGLSRAQLALLAATTPAELTAIEEGVQTATDDALRRRLLRALDADWDELFELVGVDRFGRSSPLRTR